MMRDIVIKSFNGIGDLLFLTPSLPVIKKAYPDLRILVNTNYPRLLSGNPYVDAVNATHGGMFLGYPDPIHKTDPTQHHILSDWELICRNFQLTTETPQLKPELYLDLPDRDDLVRVQLLHKGQWHGKKSGEHRRTRHMPATKGMAHRHHFLWTGWPRSCPRRASRARCARDGGARRRRNRCPRGGDGTKCPGAPKGVHREPSRSRRPLPEPGFRPIYWRLVTNRARSAARLS